MSIEVKKLCDEIKSKYSLTDYIKSKGMDINRAGFISCIFHKEKTPSCQINKGNPEWFYCHGCHKSGSIIDFYAEMEGLAVGKAIHELSKGIDFSFSLRDIQRELDNLGKDTDTPEEKLEYFNIMVSIYCFSHLRKVRDKCPDDVFSLEFSKVDGFLHKFDKALWSKDEGRVSELYKKICDDDFLINRFKSLEKKDDGNNI